MENQGTVVSLTGGGTKTTVETSVGENTTLGKRATNTRTTKTKRVEKPEGPPKKQRKKSTKTDACWDVFEIIPGKSSKARKKSKNDTLSKEDERFVGNNTETGSRKAHCISSVDGDCTREKKRKSKKDRKKIKKEHLSKEVEHIVGTTNGASEDEVYCISLGDEDCSKGMKKWIIEYHQARPGLKVLQQRIDDFIVAHEARLEEERKEKEARLAEGGWTVVVHQKGRKKTTELESGTTVGSVAQAAVEDKLGKKKQQEIGPNFYRFQRKEAQRNELFMLQSKFEQDKKRIQQMRASRKFRPY